jgi:hypothetical protein
MRAPRTEVESAVRTRPVVVMVCAERTGKTGKTGRYRIMDAIKAVR